MDKTYNPQEIEQRWYATWEKNGYFKPKGTGPSYCIMIPPPNVTGSLHMGHGFQDSLMDALIRYHRMCGNQTLWQAGTDHAGIATQMVVERLLAKEGLTRHDLGRDAFLERVWQWKESSGSTITQQLRRLGTSLDWERERFTLDKGMSHAVQTVFIKLFEAGLIYRGKRLVNWDPKFHTAISDLEVENVERKSHLWHIRYPLVDGSGFLEIATTRPETLLGDMAVAVHPEDPRYQSLIGKSLQLPLCNRTIPIIADEAVDPSFATGCVKITPAHDFNDYQMGLRHQLTLFNIFTPDAKINDEAPEAYRGLDRFVARKRIVADLETLGLLVKIEDHTHTVPVGDRSGEIIEPYLTEQWYVKTKPLAEPALDAVRTGKIRFVPENWTNTYNQWLENIEDWCISRQLWWGHRIPAWYDAEGKVYVGDSEAAIRQQHQLADTVVLTQDNDVLDTWFSSALWPFATLGWPEQTPDFKTFYPTNVLVTGFDIIFFWVARMIMFGLYFTGEIPFQDVLVTGLIRDAQGHKMSKSKGNVLDPLDLIDGIDLESLVSKRTTGLMQPQLEAKIAAATRKEYPDGISAHGTDAVRFTYCALASPGRDIRFDMGRLEGYRNFCNKLWNAARYVMMHTENHAHDQNDEKLFSLADDWIQQRLQKVTAEVHHYFKIYRFDLLTQTLYDFIWHDYCDWYLELSKPVLYADAPDAKLQRGTRFSLLSVLESILRLVHPIMPFITEEIWQRIAPLAGCPGDSLMIQAYPQAETANTDPHIESDIKWLQDIITGVRNIRGEMNLAPALPVPLFFYRGDSQDLQRFTHYQHTLQALLKAESLTWLQATDTPPPAATTTVGTLEILIPLAGLIDQAAELQRLQKAQAKIQKTLLALEQKLANPKFAANAPADIIDKVRTEQEELLLKMGQLSAQIEKVRNL
jgi:valyl-tRNA synthetase